MQSAWYPHVRIFQQQAENLHIEPTKYESSKKFLSVDMERQLILGGNMPRETLKPWLKGGYIIYIHF